MTWEPSTRTAGRSLRGDMQRLQAIGDPRHSLYRDAHYFSATVEVDPERMRAWLPRGVHLTEPARADLFTAYFPDNGFASPGYHESGLFVHVKTRRGTGIHCPWMIVDDDVALIIGRELLGYPKKLGEIEWTVTDTAITAGASRRGHKLLGMRGHLGEAIADPPPILGRPHRNVVGVAGVFPPWIVAFTPRERVIEVRRVDNFTLDIGGSERDPLDHMGVGRVVEARLHRVDLLGVWSPPIPIRPLTPLHTAARLRPRTL